MRNTGHSSQSDPRSDNVDVKQPDLSPDLPAGEVQGMTETPDSDLTMDGVEVMQIAAIQRQPRTNPNEAAQKTYQTSDL